MALPGILYHCHTTATFFFPQQVFSLFVRRIIANASGAKTLLGLKSHHSLQDRRIGFLTLKSSPISTIPATFTRMHLLPYKGSEGGIIVTVVIQTRKMVLFRPLKMKKDK